MQDHQVLQSSQTIAQDLLLCIHQQEPPKHSVEKQQLVCLPFHLYQQNLASGSMF